MILDLIGLIIPCLIWSTILFAVLDIFLFRWVLGENGRVIAFLVLFALCFGSVRSRISNGMSRNDNIKKTPIAVEYDQIMKKETASVQYH